LELWFLRYASGQTHYTYADVLITIPPIGYEIKIYPRFRKWGTNHGEREREERVAPRGGVWRGVSWGRVSEAGYTPFPRKFFFDFELKMASFCAFWQLILLQLNCLSYTHKLVSLDFGL